MDSDRCETISTEKFVTSNYYETIFELHPFAGLVVDDNIRVIDFNRAGFHLIGKELREVNRLLAGEAMQCIHATEAPGGCGTTPDCQECVLRNSATETFLSQKGVRRIACMELHRDGAVVKVPFLVATAPIVETLRVLTLVTLQDLREIPSLGCSFR